MKKKLTKKELQKQNNAILESDITQAERTSHAITPHSKIFTLASDKADFSKLLYKRES